MLTQQSGKRKIVPIVFCNITWMRDYCGDDDDIAVNGGSYIRETGSGNECLNFATYIDDANDEDQMFLLGSYETKTTHDVHNQTHIERIRGCATLKKEEVAEDVIVVWCATAPDKGSHVVGWYRHAKVYRHYNFAAIELEDGTQEDRMFNVFCLNKDATLLPEEERYDKKWDVARKRGDAKFGFGQANIWYASEPEADSYIQQLIQNMDLYDARNFN